MFSPRPTSNTAPGCLFMLWSCLPICLCFSACFWICLPQDSTGMTVPTKQHIYILMRTDFIRLISHVAQDYKYTLVIPHRVQLAIIFTSSLHTVQKKQLGKTNTYKCTHAKQSPLLPFACDGGPWRGQSSGIMTLKRSTEACVCRMKEERRREERKRLHPYSISGTGPE